MAGRTGVDNTLRLRKGISPPAVAGRPDRSPGQASGKRAQKTAVLIEVPVSGRLGYLTTSDV